MPDETPLDGGVAAETPQTDSGLAAEIDAEIASTSADDGGSPATGSVAESQPEVNLRTIAAQRGYDYATQYTDDNQFLNELLHTAREHQSRRGDLEMAEQVRGNWDAYQNFLRTQQQQQVKQEEPKSPRGSPPPYDTKIESQLWKDQGGTIRYRDGTIVSPVILEQRAAWHRWRQERMDAFQNNPEEFFNPVVERATQKALEAYQKVREQERREQTAEGILNQHQPWLYNNGQLTQDGMAYQHFLNEAKNHGIADPAGKDRYARSMMELNLLRAQFQQAQQPAAQAAPAADAGEAAKQNYLAATRKPKNGTNAGYAGAPAEPITNGNLRSRLTAEFDALGLKDEDFR